MAITNLTNTTWIFNETLSNTFPEGTFNINFTSDGENFTYIYLTNWGSCALGYNGTANAYYNGWKKEGYRSITFIDGESVENADLIAFIQANATEIKPLEFNETKTALKIYEDLSQAEYERLEKDNNSFYQVNDVGIYKGAKLVSIVKPRFDRPTKVYTGVLDEETGNYYFEGVKNELKLGDVVRFSSWNGSTYTSLGGYGIVVDIGLQGVSIEVNINASPQDNEWVCGNLLILAEKSIDLRGSLHFSVVDGNLTMSVSDSGYYTYTFTLENRQAAPELRVY